jgi:hypothetical protein
MQDRREFFRSLIAGGAAVAKRPQRQITHPGNEVVYHGPMLIPERVAGIIAEHPSIKRCNRSSHLVSRYAEPGWTWLFRCQIPASRHMVGEIVRTPEGATRVHCWSAADPARTCGGEPAAIIARKTAALGLSAPGPADEGSV